MYRLDLLDMDLIRLMSLKEMLVLCYSLSSYWYPDPLLSLFQHIFSANCSSTRQHCDGQMFQLHQSAYFPIGPLDRVVHYIAKKICLQLINFHNLNLKTKNESRIKDKIIRTSSKNSTQSKWPSLAAR